MNGINWDVNANDSFSKKTEFEALNDSNKNWQAGKTKNTDLISFAEIRRKLAVSVHRIKVHVVLPRHCYKL